CARQGYYDYPAWFAYW
nr:immunoglobulin heavy chain junction region [Mus musculus]MBK4196283.1 immunoglobulin heavy chain junction region [Mus musculus]